MRLLIFWVRLYHKVSFGEKAFRHFIGYKNAKKVRPLCMLLQKMSACRRDFDKTKYMPFLIKDNELLEKDNEIWETVKNSLKKRILVNQYPMKNI